MLCPHCHAENRDEATRCSTCGAPLGPGVDGAPEDASVTRPLDAPLPLLTPGTLLAGKYRILDELGHGGMGIVYKAEDLTLKRAVALKVLPPHLVDAPAFRERFTLEAQAAAALSHPNICVVHEVGMDQGRPYIAMEFVEGETLRDRLRRGPLEPGEAVGMVDQVAAGLEEAHAKGIIHRDIKSANVMVTPAGRAKVMDFGLAKLQGEVSLTRTGTTLGTVAYMSPEQARGEELDARTDIWSLGVVLYELLTGELPFKGDHDLAVIHAILHTAPKPPSRIRHDLPPGLDAIVLKALVKNPGSRYQSMTEVREDLAAVADGLKPLKARRPLTWLGTRTAAIVAAVILALALSLGLNVGGLRDRVFGGAGRVERAVKLAVLPFENLTGDPEQDYLSEGLTQEMITLLGRLHPKSLGVIARTSVMRYKGTNTPIDQIGRELGVDYILEGSARREGGRVRVSAELIQVGDQTQLWSDAFEREMAGVLSLQNEVAREVAKALALKLLPSEQARLATAESVDPEVHEAYLKGFLYTMKGTPADLDIAQKYFDLALEKDPGYARAYAGLAWLWLWRNQMGLVPPDEAGPKAKAAALRAIELDESFAGAHEALAEVRFLMDWDWDGARESFLRSLELNPNVATAQAMYAHLLVITGHGEEALARGKQSVDLDPFNPSVHAWYAFVLYAERRYEEALAAARKALSLQSDSTIGLAGVQLAMHELGREREAFEAAKGYVKVSYNDPKVDTALDEGYARGGYAVAMKSVGDALVARLPEVYALPAEIANWYALAGEKEKAIEWLEKGLEPHDPIMPYIGCYRAFDGLHSDPRFQELLRKMKLPALDRK